jgi:hypothetical protein
LASVNNLNSAAALKEVRIGVPASGLNGGRLA